MGIVVSLLLIGVGAIMRFAVSAHGQGWNVHTAGVVLIVIGAVGAALSIAFWASWGGFNHYGRRSTVIVDHTPAASSERTIVREKEVL